MVEFEVICEELDISAGKKFLLKNKIRLTLLEPDKPAIWNSCCSALGIYGRCYFFVKT